jgi:hypothetical protein
VTSLGRRKTRDYIYAENSVVCALKKQGINSGFQQRPEDVRKPAQTNENVQFSGISTLSLTYKKKGDGLK